PPGRGYVVLQWGIWRAGGIAVPLAVTHPSRELEQVLDDARPLVVVAHGQMAERLQTPARERGLRLLSSEDLASEPAQSEAPTDGTLPRLTPARRALMVYTSGTTGKPKGVVTTHGNVTAQITALVEAW